MNKTLIEQWIEEGYNLLKDGQPVKVETDLWEYLDTLDKDEEVYVLREIVHWEPEELEAL